MLRRLFFAIFLALQSIFSFSQKSDLSYPKALNDSATYYHDISNFEKALKFAEGARLAAENLGLKEELFRSYLMLGNIKSREGHLRQSQQFYNKSLFLANQSGNPNQQAKALSNLASTLSQLGEYDSAELILREIINLKNVDKNVLISSYGRLGSNRKRQQQYDIAIDFYLKSLAISREIKDSLSAARTLANIGNIYVEQKDATRALGYYQEALSLLDSRKHALSISGISVLASDAYQMLKEYDEAEKILNRSLMIIKELNLPASEAYALESLGILQFNRGKTREAIFSFNKALAIQRKLDSWSNLESILLHLAECYLISNQHKKAKAVLDESFLIAQKHKHVLGLKENSLLMSKLDSANGDYGASLAHFKRWAYYKDTIFTVEKVKAIEEVNKKFQAQQKEKIIQEQKLVIEQQRTKQFFFVVLSIVIIVSVGTIYFFIQRKATVERLAEQEQQRKEKLLAIVFAQEQMQQKIARDLHDSFVQILGAAKISLESVKALAISSNFGNRIQETADIIDKACDDARTISHQLLPYSLQKDGLIIALQELLDKNPKKGNEVYAFSHAGVTDRLKNNIEINLYRIIQELVNNITKHAGATKVQIHLAQDGEKIVLSVNDNGKGFDMGKTALGAGLMNIESRLQSIRGSMRIDSEIGNGTTTIIQIPII